MRVSRVRAIRIAIIPCWKIALVSHACVYDAYLQHFNLEIYMYYMCVYTHMCARLCLCVCVKGKNNWQIFAHNIHGSWFSTHTHTHTHTLHENAVETRWLRRVNKNIERNPLSWLRWVVVAAVLACLKIPGNKCNKNYS